MLIKDAQINYFADVLKAVKSLTDYERHMITEVIVICKLLLVNPATSTTGERSFSMARRVKTWLRANIKHTLAPKTTFQIQKAYDPNKRYLRKLEDGGQHVQ